MSFSESLTAIVAENNNELLGIHPSWKRVRLGDIVDIQNGFPFPSHQFSSSQNGTPLIRIRDIQRHSTDTHFLGEYPPEFMVETGALLIGMDGDFNSAIWRGAPGLLNQRCCKLTLRSSDFDARLLPYCLPGYLAAINAHTSAITVKHLSSGTVANIPLPLPPVGEQRRIADTLDELLSDLEAGVAALERVRARLKHYRAAVLKAAVEGALTAEWRKQHPATETAAALLKRILAERRRRWEEAQLARFEAAGKTPPKDWKAKYVEPIAPDTTDVPTLAEGGMWVSLDQIAAITSGVTKGQKISDSVATRDVAYLRVANVQRGYLDLAEVKHIRATESDIEALRLLPGDVLFNEGGDRDKLGRGWIWEGQIDECIHQNHVFRARLFLGEIRPKIVSWAGNSYGQKWFMRTGKQSVNLASINMAVLRSFPVPLFPTAEQDSIVEGVEDQLSVVDHLERDLESKLKSARALRQSILRHAFTGQLVPQDPNDEPASELLKRIAVEREERARLARAGKQAKPKTRASRGRAMNS